MNLGVQVGTHRESTERDEAWVGEIGRMTVHSAQDQVHCECSHHGSENLRNKANFRTLSAAWSAAGLNARLQGMKHVPVRLRSSVILCWVCFLCVNKTL